MIVRAHPDSHGQALGKIEVPCIRIIVGGVGLASGGMVETTGQGLRGGSVNIDIPQHCANDPSRFLAKNFLSLRHILIKILAILVDDFFNHVRQGPDSAIRKSRISRGHLH